MASTTGRRVVVPLTNKSGGGVIAGDVVVIDTGNDDAFTTTTTGGFTGLIGIAQEAIANNATGLVLISGEAALVNVAASVTRGHYGKTHTVAKQATSTSARAAGTFCQFKTGGTTPKAVMYPPDGASAALGAWTTYTPTWTTSGTPPALGNGTLVGRYKQLDANTVLVHISLTAGTTTTFGTGTWSFALPVAAVAGQGAQYLTGHILDSGTDNKLAAGTIGAGASTVEQVVPEGGNVVTNTVPQTWATGDQLNLSGMYEA